MRTRTLVVGAAVVGWFTLAAPAHAQELTLEGLADDALIFFMMVASALVFLMHAGFALLESGLGRAKNTTNILAKNLMTLVLGFLAYYAVGWALMYGSQIGGLIGTDGFFLGAMSSYEPLAGSLSIDFLYQAMFAATAATIVSGACAERMKLGAYLILVLALTAFIYPVVGAWKWGGGWLDQLGFLDFAGSTLVHMVGGVAALVAATILGPRRGKFRADGKPNVIPGHSMPFVVLGTLLLFFGWFGFNGGSVLALDGPVIADVLVATALAGCAGGVAAAYFTRLRFGKFDVAMIANGILAGLVGITAGADVVGNLGAVLVGSLAGVVVVGAVAFFDRVRIDDPVGAISVHGVCGALGTLWVGLFAAEGGLLRGDGFTLLGVQALGVVSAAAFVAVATALVVLAVKATMGIRVSEEEELEGLDIHEHGMYAYPELAVGPAAFPGGPVTAPRGELVGRGALDERTRVDA